MACSCCACRSIPHDIQCSSKRHACCYHDVDSDRTVVGAWTAWPSDFEDHPSVVSCSDLLETSKLPPCCPVIPEHCSGCMGCFAHRLQGCFLNVESTTCFSLQHGKPLLWLPEACRPVDGTSMNKDCAAIDAVGSMPPL